MSILKAIQTKSPLSWGAVRERLCGPNLIALFILGATILFPRVLPFPSGFLTVDEMIIGRWISQMTQALLAGDWPHTANDTYPAVTLMWFEAGQVELARLWPATALSPTRMLSDADEDVFASLPRRRLALALLNTALILVIFWLLRRLYNHFIALTATILLALDPFLLTQARVFRTEGLATSLMLLSVLTLLLYARERQTRWLPASGFLAGLAVLTKITALYLLPFTALTLLLWPLWLGEREIWPLLTRAARAVLLWSLILSFTIFALWPALWVAPVVTFQSMIIYLQQAATDVGRVWDQGRFFFHGQVMTTDPGISFYLWVLAYRITPIVWLGLLAALVALAIVAQRRSATAVPSDSVAAPRRSATAILLRRELAPTLLLLLYILCYFVAMSLGVSKVDRYLLPIFPVLSILAAVGFAALARLFARRPNAGLNWAFWGVLWAGSAGLAWAYHPYYFTYWNPLLGGGQAALKMVPVGSGEGIDLMLDYLNTLPHAAELNLTGPGLHQGCRLAFAGHCLPPAEFLNSDYFITFVSAVQRQQPLANIEALIPDVALASRYSYDGVDYARLYKMPPGLQYVGRRLGNYGIFSGYRLSTTTAGAGDSLEISLFWQNGSQGWGLADSEFFVKLLDETGQIYQTVPAQLKPEFSSYLSQRDQILAFSIPLKLPPDLPLGVYKLKFGLRVKATGVETWEFPLTSQADTLTVNRGAVHPSPESLSMQHRLEQVIGSAGLTLLGYDSPLPPTSQQEKATVLPRFYFYWRAEQPLTENYRLNLTLLDDQGQVVAAWDNLLAPQSHPLTDWLPAEMVKLPLLLETGRQLPAGAYQPVLTIWPLDHPAVEPIATINLSRLPEEFVLIPPVKGQHHLDDVTFGHNLDLLGFDLIGQKGSAAAGGSLQATFYWLNRQPLIAQEAQVEVLNEQGSVITRQILPVPASAGFPTWQSVSQYTFALADLPSSLRLKTRPVGAKAWDSLVSGQAVTGQLLIDDVLSKMVIVLDK